MEHEFDYSVTTTAYIHEEGTSTVSFWLPEHEWERLEESAQWQSFLRHAKESHGESSRKTENLVTVNATLDTGKLDEMIKKVARLADLLEEAKSLADEITSSKIMVSASTDVQL